MRREHRKRAQTSQWPPPCGLGKKKASEEKTRSALLRRPRNRVPTPVHGNATNTYQRSRVPFAACRSGLFCVGAGLGPAFPRPPLFPFHWFCASEWPFPTPPPSAPGQMATSALTPARLGMGISTVARTHALALPPRGRPTRGRTAVVASTAGVPMPAAAGPTRPAGPEPLPGILQAPALIHAAVRVGLVSEMTCRRGRSERARPGHNTKIGLRGRRGARGAASA